MSDLTSLKAKFSHAHDVDRIEQKAKEDPGFLFPCLMQSSRPIHQWPEGVSIQSAINDRFYTARLTYENLKKAAGLRDVVSITIR